MGTDIHGVMQAKVNDKWQDIPHNYPGNRHYMMFAWLGNVRNGFGFAGVPTHSPLIPLSDCRGFPEDFEMVNDDHPMDLKNLSAEDQEWRKKYPEDYGSGYWMGDHSHSWVSGDEVINGALPTIEKTGIVSIEEYRALNGASPESYCGGIHGPGVVVAPSPEEIRDETTHVGVSWDSPIAEELDYFIVEIRRLSAEHGEIRFVFGFDS